MPKSKTPIEDVGEQFGIIIALLGFINIKHSSTSSTKKKIVVCSRRFCVRSSELVIGDSESGVSLGKNN